ncbi:MAG: type IV secretory system conjugative DNA transfer family protein [Flavobacteriales bacterium]|nr:type IV secretory system conjugative DNA transfer family protein [Flavobacteriales bacterium]
MANIISVPSSDLTKEITITFWNKKIGDYIEKGDVLLKLSTDKVDMEFDSEYNGTLLHIALHEGDTGYADDMICIIGQEGEDYSHLLPQKHNTPPITISKKEQKPSIHNAETSLISAPRNSDFKAPSPQIDGLMGYENLEIYKDSTTGIETLLTNNEGFIVGRLGGELLRYKTDAHLLTISPTGGGKTTGVIIPNILDHNGSAFVVDIRGETVAKTATAKRLLGHRVVVLDPYQITEGKWGIDSYNFFDRVRLDLGALDTDDRIQRIVSAIMFDPTGRMSKEPIWDNATRNLLVGLISYVLKYLPKEKHNLVEVLDILNYSSSELEWFTAKLTTLLEHDEKASNDRTLKGLLKILTEGKSQTKITDNALIQAQTLLTWVGNQSFEKVLDTSTFSFEQMQQRKTTVYLVVPEEYLENCASWVRLLIESAIFSMKDVFKSKGVSTASLAQQDRVLFLLDELPAFGLLDIISKGMATLRGRGINLWLFLQNIAQLDDIYGDKKARTIIGNAAAIQLFNSNEIKELEYFTKLIGEEFYDVQSISKGVSNTEGESVAKGTSHTISNSESVSHTQGTSDSFSEAVSYNWGNSFSNSTSETTGTNKNYTQGQGSSVTKAKGRNKGRSTNLNRNTLQGNQKGEGKNNRTSYNKSKGKTKNSSISEGVNFSK